MKNTYLSSGLRMAVAIVTPLAIGVYYQEPMMGLTMGLGSMSAGLSDAPGSFQQKGKGLLLSVLSIFVISFLMGLAAFSTVATLFGLILLSFFFSLWTVLGHRMALIGNAALIVMTFTLSKPYTNIDDAFTQSLFYAIGGLWYAFLSLLLWRIDSYRTAELAVSKVFLNTASYLQSKSRFFTDGEEKPQAILLQEQQQIAEAQDQARHLLFNRRSALQGTTARGRSLVLLLRSIIDIQERLSVTHHDYQQLQKWFGGLDILPQFVQVFENLSEQINVLGMAISKGGKRIVLEDLHQQITVLEARVDAIKENHFEKIPLEEFVALKNIIRNLHHVNQLLQEQYELSNLDDTELVRKKDENKLDFQQFLPSSKTPWSVIFENLTLESTNYRHALRMSAAMAFGYLVGLAFDMEQSYWILLTIAVIMKPSFSATKERTIQRIVGTAFGALVAVLLLMIIQEWPYLHWGLFFISALATFSFLSYNYGIGVLFITAYVIMLFAVVEDVSWKLAWARIVDTLVGGGVAFVANYLILPNWQKETIPHQLRKLTKALYEYYFVVTLSYIEDEASVQEFKLKRKEAYLNLANINASFQSMLAEPSSQKQKSEALYEFVVGALSMSSHIATLAVYRDEFQKVTIDIDLKPWIQGVGAEIKMVEKAFFAPWEVKALDIDWNKMEDYVQSLIDQRKNELKNKQEETPTKYLLTNVVMVKEQLQYISNMSQMMLDQSKDLVV